MRFGRQTTLRQRIQMQGIGVHCNRPVTLTLHPADANCGIVFERTGLPGGRNVVIEANWSKVSMSRLCTVIGIGVEGSVSTIEHLMAALSGLGVDNVKVEIDGPEMPIMDGSAAAFVEAIDRAGIATLAASRRYLKIRKPVRVEEGRAYSELRPAAHGFRLEVEIDFSAKVIGRQKKTVDLDAGSFRRDIARARTFGFLHEVEQLWKMGFALGSSLENSVALDNDRILNPEGLRFSDEFVRHKTLDAVGDLALAGAPIIGAYHSYCGGHKMNVAVLAALFADTDAFEFIEAPARREAGHAELGIAAMSAYAPDMN